MNREQRARMGTIITTVYAEWAAEQSVDPDLRYAGNRPTQYAEHADLMSADGDAQQDLHERTTAALSAAGITLYQTRDPVRAATLSRVMRLARTLQIDLETDSLTASGSQSSWRDQLRIPKGNGRRSGRWTFTPWKHLDDLTGLLNSLGTKSNPESRKVVAEALQRLNDFDPNGFEVNDPLLHNAIRDVADLLAFAPKTGDASLDDAFQQATEGVLGFADTDWTLFSEDTDIDGASLGRATNKSIWEGDLPGDTPVNPDLADKTSQWLADDLLRIKNHPVAPSPSARRKRASYLKELNDRRDRDELGIEDTGVVLKPGVQTVTIEQAKALLDSLDDAGSDERVQFTRNALKAYSYFGDTATVIVSADDSGKMTGAAGLIFHVPEGVMVDDETTIDMPAYITIDYLAALKKGAGPGLVKEAQRIALERNVSLYLEATPNSHQWWLTSPGITEDPDEVGAAFYGWNVEGLKTLLGGQKKPGVEEEGWTTYDPPIPAKGEPPLQVGDVVRKAPGGVDWYITGAHLDLPYEGWNYAIARSPGGSKTSAAHGQNEFYISRRQTPAETVKVEDYNLDITADQLTAARDKFHDKPALDGLVTAIRERRWDDAMHRAIFLQNSESLGGNEVTRDALQKVMERLAEAKQATKVVEPVVEVEPVVPERVLYTAQKFVEAYAAAEADFNLPNGFVSDETRAAVNYWNKWQRAMLAAGLTVEGKGISDQIEQARGQLGQVTEPVADKTSDRAVVTNLRTRKGAENYIKRLGYLPGVEKDDSRWNGTKSIPIKIIWTVEPRDAGDGGYDVIREFRDVLEVVVTDEALAYGTFLGTSNAATVGDVSDALATTYDSYKDDPSFEMRSFDPHSLWAGQDHVLNREAIETALSGGTAREDTPIVARIDGRDVLIDGHHRVVAAALKGEQIQVLYKDIGGNFEDVVFSDVELPKVVSPDFGKRVGEPVKYPTAGGGFDLVERIGGRTPGETIDRVLYRVQKRDGVWSVFPPTEQSPPLFSAGTRREVEKWADDRAAGIPDPEEEPDAPIPPGVAPFPEITREALNGYAPFLPAQIPTSFSGWKMHLMATDSDETWEAWQRVRQIIEDRGLGAKVATRAFHEKAPAEYPAQVGKGVTLYFPRRETAQEDMQAIVDAMVGWPHDKAPIGDEWVAPGIGLRWELNEDPGTDLDHSTYYQKYRTADDTPIPAWAPPNPLALVRQDLDRDSEPRDLDLRKPEDYARARVGDVVARNTNTGEVWASVEAVVDGIVFQKHRDDVWDLDDATRQSTADSVNAVLAEFPGVKPPRISQTNGKGSMASAGPGGIDLSQAMTDDVEAARQAVEWEGMSIGLPGAEGHRKAVVTHEMGHYLNHALDAIPEAKAEYLAIVNESVSSRELGYSVGSDAALDKRSPRWQIDPLSTTDSPSDMQSVYANENEREWFGEAFADAFLHGDAASPASKRLMAVVHKYLGGNENEPNVNTLDSPGAAQESRDRLLAEIPAESLRQPAVSKFYNFLSSSETFIDPETGDEKYIAVLAESAQGNAFDSAVDRGYATKREGAWKAQTIYEPIPPITDKEFDDWVAIHALAGLESLFDSYGLDRNGVPYNQQKPFKLEHDRIQGDVRGASDLKTARMSVVRLRSQFYKELRERSDLIPVPVETGGALDRVMRGIESLDWSETNGGLATLESAMIDLSESEPWKATLTELVRASDTWKEWIDAAPKHDPKFAHYADDLKNVEKPYQLQGVIQDLWLLLSNDPVIQADRQRQVSALRRMAEAVTEGDPERWAAGLVTLRETWQYDDTFFKEIFEPVFEKIVPKWQEKFAKAQTAVEDDFRTRYGSLTSGDTTPEAVVDAIGVFYGSRTHGNNCVLASTAYELRRRGLDVHPKQAKKGRNAGSTQQAWFTVPWGTSTMVHDLKGRQIKERSRRIHQHAIDNYPVGSRGTIRAGWKGRNFGHIWNWERTEDGVIFYDPQTGETIAPDREDYWKQVDYRNVTFQRLDNVALKADIEVMIAPEKNAKDARELQVAGRTYRTLVLKKEAAARASRATSGGYSAEAARLYQEWTAARDVLVAFLDTPEGKRLKKAGDAFPILDPEKYRMR